MNRIVFFALICSLFALFSCRDEKQAVPEKETHQTTVTAGAKGDRLTIAVSVPAGHHAYLDSGKEGVLIPISIDWKEAIAKKFIQATPRSVAIPDGVQDEQMGARVLRGKGDFVYEARFDKLEDQTIKVRSQICDDVKGICYRPTTQDIPVVSVK
ncbi:MAG TPA: protein-disulfide reductase DsbD family protein [Leptospiraceae bacterium]|nr:protein-disulfide reductase DsbD family protein [Leptospiraceae bacterium]